MGASSVAPAEAPTSERLPKPLWTLARIFCIALQTVWTIILLAVTIWKVTGDSGGWDEVFRFFTNWVWFANLLFFFVDLVVGYAVPEVFHYFSFYAVWVVQGLNWAVFWLVFPLLHENNDLIRNAARQYPFGFVMGGDRLFHVLTLVTGLLWTLLRFEELKQVTRRIVRARMHFWLTLLLAGVVGPCIIGLVYGLTHRSADVYGLAFPLGVVAFGSVIILFVFNGIFLYAVSELGSRHSRYLSFYATTLVWIVFGYGFTLWFITVYGSMAYFSRLEFWVWIYSLVYFTTDLLLPHQLRLARDFLHWYAFWPLNTLVWLVFWLSFVAFGDNALKFMDVNGDNDYSGHEVLMDRVLRVVPLVFLLVYIFTRLGQLAKSVRTQPLLHAGVEVTSRSQAKERKHASDDTYIQKPTWASFWALVLSVWIVPMLIAGVWYIVFPPCRVYGLCETPGIVWALLFFTVATVFGFGTFLIFRLSEPRERVRT